MNCGVQFFKVVINEMHPLYTEFCVNNTNITNWMEKQVKNLLQFIFKIKDGYRHNWKLLILSNIWNEMLKQMQLICWWIWAVTCHRGLSSEIWQSAKWELVLLGCGQSCTAQSESQHCELLTHSMSAAETCIIHPVTTVAVWRSW